MSRISIPYFDIRETPSHYMLSLSVARELGEKVEIELTEDELIIKGQGALNYRSAHPQVSLKINSESKSIAAHYQNGLLTIALPKNLSRQRLTSWGLSTCL